MTTPFRNTLALMLLAASFPLTAAADDWDKDNYPPDDKTIVIQQTNLPIVFIDTRCGGADITPIHRDYRIAVRMKIINNADGLNYGDTLTHPNQHTDYEGWIGIKYRGNTSFTTSDKKPYGFKTLKTNDAEGKKEKVSLLGMPKDNDWVMLAPYHDRSMIRDVLMYELARPYFEYTPRMRYCELILDGTYYGVYILGEKAGKGKGRLNLDDPGDEGDELTGGYQVQVDRNDEEHYYTSKYKARNENGTTLITNNKIYFQYKFPDYEDMMPDHPAQLEYLHHQIDAMEDALNSNDFRNPETGYRKYIDVTSFIDQELSQEFSFNADGYRLSTNLYKRRDSQDPRFKTTLWDFNLAFGNNLYESIRKGTWGIYNRPATLLISQNHIPFWWARLMEDPDYVKELKERWYTYRNSNYSEQHIMQVIDSLTTMLNAQGAQERNSQAWPRWGKTIALTPLFTDIDTYEKEISSLKAWILDRMAWLDQQLGYEETGITNATRLIPSQPKNIYNLQGISISRPGKGVFIIRDENGRTHKAYLAQPTK